MACGVAAQAYRDAGYKGNERAIVVCASRLLNRADIQDRIQRLQAQKDAFAARMDITKERLVQRFWDIVHDPAAKRGEAVQAGIQVAKMLGWNAPTRVEHDLGDRVRAYLEDIRSRPLRTITAQVVDVPRLTP